MFEVCRMDSFEQGSTLIVSRSPFQCLAKDQPTHVRPSTYKCDEATGFKLLCMRNFARGTCGKQHQASPGALRHCIRWMAPHVEVSPKGGSPQSSTVASRPVHLSLASHDGLSDSSAASSRSSRNTPLMNPSWTQATAGEDCKCTVACQRV